MDPTCNIRFVFCIDVCPRTHDVKEKEGEREREKDSGREMIQEQLVWDHVCELMTDRGCSFVQFEIRDT